MMSIYAASQVAELTALKAARDGEEAKLGAMCDQRVRAIQQFLRGHLGDEVGRVMSTMLVTAKHVEGFEKLMSKFLGGGPSFSHQHREAESPRLSDAEWNNMSYSEKRAYAQSATDAAARRNGGGR